MPAGYSADDKHRGGRDAEDDDIEAEALILHRFSTDDQGRATVSSIPSAQGTARQARVTDAYDDLDDADDADDGRLGKLPPRGTLEGSNPSTQLDKTGRPAWFRGLLEGEVPALGLGGRHAGMSATAAQRNKRRRARMFRLAALALGILLVVAVFSVALGPRIGLDMDRVYEYAGDKWYGDSGVMPYEFNREIGWPGSYTTGKPPHLADEQTDPRLRASPTQGASPIQTAVPGYGGDAKVQPFEHMGPFTPYRSSSGFGVDDAKYGGTPSSLEASTTSPSSLADQPFCKLQQVHILHRHGARYPTERAPPTLFDAFLREHPEARFSGPLSFINSYKYRLGTELLTPVGRQQLYDSGAKAAILYGALAVEDLKEKSRTGLPKKLFARAGSQQRIVDSGFAWLAGFWGQHWANSTNFEIQIESEGFNTTTAPEFACRGASKPGMFPGGDAEAHFVDRYLAEATRRLQRDVQGATLTPMVVYGMQSLCPFDTVAFGRSDFCSLFTADEWLGFEYSYDLKFQYSYGAPSPIGHAMGLGWLNELLARLKGEKWDRSTQTSENATLNTNDRTFPVDRRVYVDFTHDSTVTAVLAALDLPKFAEPIDKERRQDERTFRSSNIVPFAARLVVEVWGCPSTGGGGGAAAATAGSMDKWVRLKLNDATVPLSQLKGCEERPDGLCSLAAFLETQRARNDHGWWDVCEA
ncbi:uncharacterized protein PFL1_04737 [Pseudozyma flocculosa PF-1]|uniref:Related to 3-phytase A n=2 Tax=Pseudozyma flocculosa TaxID=84751 RepID=A0A5C3F448_9BASI|nr:uncharacterized protein PFL1_04737 [Pseudozyma flocculosa PF-1]EPQ27599.1 hypothetical protein PFL1_04737 [Pseudozyma flocculosa PF-1]SPO39274.1 related to 3-phytase A precursor [Pseudozyma flocculosa]